MLLSVIVGRSHWCSISSCDYITVGWSSQPLVGLWVGFPVWGHFEHTGAAATVLLSVFSWMRVVIFTWLVHRGAGLSGSHADSFLQWLSWFALHSHASAHSFWPFWWMFSRSHCEVCVRLYLHFPDSVGLVSIWIFSCEMSKSFANFSIGLSAFFLWIYRDCLCILYKSCQKYVCSGEDK